MRWRPRCRTFSSSTPAARSCTGTCGKVILPFVRVLQHKYLSLLMAFVLFPILNSPEEVHGWLTSRPPAGVTYFASFRKYFCTRCIRMNARHTAVVEQGCRAVAVMSEPSFTSRTRFMVEKIQDVIHEASATSDTSTTTVRERSPPLELQCLISKHSICRCREVSRVQLPTRAFLPST